MTPTDTTDPQATSPCSRVRPRGVVAWALVLAVWVGITGAVASCSESLNYCEQLNELDARMEGMSRNEQTDYAQEFSDLLRKCTEIDGGQGLEI